MAKTAVRSRGSKRKSRRNASSTRAFREGLALRGEAAEVGPGQELPAGATHQIVSYDEHGIPIVKRRRFSLSGA
jgi:hypothetical protein